MNNFHIYEEVGRGKDSVVYKVRYLSRYFLICSTYTYGLYNSKLRVGRKRQSSM